MSEEVTPTDDQKKGLTFLDLDEGQFGTVVFLSSASAQMPGYIGSENLRNEMVRLLESGKYGTVDEALAWIRGHRNNILKLNSMSAFGLNLLNQVEDLVVDRMMGLAGNEEQNEGEE